MNKIVIVIISYLVGSLPTAYLVTKIFFKKNILIEGTGNAGGRNVFDVTGSRAAGGIVTLIDMIKGVLGAWIGVMTGHEMLAGAAVVTGHNFSVWLKFRGGRGLATSGGVAIIFAPIVIALWGVTWWLASALHVPMHRANILATCAIFLVWVIPFVHEKDCITMSIIAVLILIAHRKENWYTSRLN